MHLKPAKNRAFQQIPADIRQSLLASHVIPVQEQFWDLWNDQAPIIILVGSYGSGKSFFVADWMINRALRDPYFRCFYGRKVYGNVKGSVFATITEQIEKHNIPGFTYSSSDNSSLVIRHQNGNSFIPFGADKIDKLKSIKEPSHFLLEELDQFTADDFGMCMSRLGRTDKARTQMICMCNTDKIYEEHWLYPILFGDNAIGAKINWSSFRENSMLPDIEEYDRILRIRAMGDEDLYNSIANATPGVRNKQNAWIYVNTSDTIIDEPIHAIPGNTVYLSFDFNNEPMTCTAWQFNSGIHNMSGDGCFVNCIGEFETSMAETEEEIIALLCKKIKTAYPFHPLRITGDSNGRARLKGVPGNKSIYYLLARYLNVHDQCLDVPSSNLEHTVSRALCNTWIYNHKGVKISRVTTPKLAADIRIAKANEERPDELVKDRKVNKLDYFDTFRYIPATYFKYFIGK